MFKIIQEEAMVPSYVEGDDVSNLETVKQQVSQHVLAGEGEDASLVLATLHTVHEKLKEQQVPQGINNAFRHLEGFEQDVDRVKREMFMNSFGKASLHPEQEIPVGVRLAAAHAFAAVVDAASELSRTPIVGETLYEPAEHHEMRRAFATVSVEFTSDAYRADAAKSLAMLMRGDTQLLKRAAAACAPREEYSLR
jgi:hypothetical protein